MHIYVDQIILPFGRCPMPIYLMDAHLPDDTMACAPKSLQEIAWGLFVSRDYGMDK